MEANGRSARCGTLQLGMGVVRYGCDPEKRLASVGQHR
jgi:hypothetical protein